MVSPTRVSTVRAHAMNPVFLADCSFHDRPVIRPTQGGSLLYIRAEPPALLRRSHPQACPTACSEPLSPASPLQPVTSSGRASWCAWGSRRGDDSKVHTRRVLRNVCSPRLPIFAPPRDFAPNLSRHKLYRLAVLGARIGGLAARAHRMRWEPSFSGTLARAACTRSKQIRRLRH